MGATPKSALDWIRWGRDQQKESKQSESAASEPPAAAVQTDARRADEAEEVVATSGDTLVQVMSSPALAEQDVAEVETPPQAVEPVEVEPAVQELRVVPSDADVIGDDVDRVDQGTVDSPVVEEVAVAPAPVSSVDEFIGSMSAEDAEDTAEEVQAASPVEPAAIEPAIDETVDQSALEPSGTDGEAYDVLFDAMPVELAAEESPALVDEFAPASGTGFAEPDDDDELYDALFDPAPGEALVSELTVLVQSDFVEDDAESPPVAPEIQPESSAIEPVEALRDEFVEPEESGFSSVGLLPPEPEPPGEQLAPSLNPVHVFDEVDLQGAEPEARIVPPLDAYDAPPVEEVDDLVDVERIDQAQDDWEDDPLPDPDPDEPKALEAVAPEAPAPVDDAAEFERGEVASDDEPGDPIVEHELHADEGEAAEEEEGDFEPVIESVEDTLDPHGDQAVSDEDEVSAPTPEVASRAPAASNSEVTFLGDAPYAFAAADFNVDGAEGHELAVRIISLAGEGNLLLDGDDARMGELIRTEDFDAGRFTFTPASMCVGASQDSFLFAVQDGDLRSSVSYTMTVYFTVIKKPTNEVETIEAGFALVFSDLNDNEINVGPGAGGGEATVTVAADHGLVFLGSVVGLTFAEGGGDGGVETVTFTGAVGAVNGALHGLTYVPNPGFVGDAELRITVDTGSGPETERLPIVVTEAEATADAVNELSDSSTATADDDFRQDDLPRIDVLEEAETRSSGRFDKFLRSVRRKFLGVPRR